VEAAKDFLSSLLQWAQRWNLETDWCLDRTIMAMRRYYGIKYILSDFSWFYPLDTVLVEENGKKYYKHKIDRIFDFPLLDTISVYDFSPLDLPPPPGGLPEWDPYLNPMKDGYLRYIEMVARERFENDPYLSILERSHREAIIRLVIEKAAEYAMEIKALPQSQARLKQVKSKLKLRTHLEWTVRVWVLGENFSKVARSAEPNKDGESLTRKAVKKAVFEILDLIEPAWAARLEERFPAGRPEEE
jgi:hypothetical protein